MILFGEGVGFNMLYLQILTIPHFVHLIHPCHHELDLHSNPTINMFIPKLRILVNLKLTHTLKPTSCIIVMHVKSQIFDL